MISSKVFLEAYPRMKGKCVKSLLKALASKNYKVTCFREPGKHDLFLANLSTPEKVETLKSQLGAKRLILCKTAKAAE